MTIINKEISLDMSCGMCQTLAITYESSKYLMSYGRSLRHSIARV